MVNRSVTLHTAYLKLVYQYLNLLKEQELYEEIINVCRTCLLYTSHPGDERQRQQRKQNVFQA